MKATEIQDLIKFVSKSGVSEVNLETKDVKLTIKNDVIFSLEVKKSIFDVKNDKKCSKFNKIQANSLEF